jgi:hypothetical protein
VPPSIAGLCRRLKEEVFDEGLTRNIPAFPRFFDAEGYPHGELTNFANIARDCGVDAKTVKEYFQVLVDALLGIMIAPYSRRQDRQVISKAGNSTCSMWGLPAPLSNAGFLRRGRAVRQNALEWPLAAAIRQGATIGLAAHAPALS